MTLKRHKQKMVLSILALKDWVLFPDTHFLQIVKSMYMHLLQNDYFIILPDFVSHLFQICAYDDHIFLLFIIDSKCM